MQQPLLLCGKVLQHLRKECFQSGMLRIREQFLRRLVLLDLAVVDEDDAVGHLAGEAHFVGDHQHGDAGVGQLFHQLKHFAHHLGVEGAGRLIEEDDVRVHRQRPGDGDALLLTTREILRILAGLMCHADALERSDGDLGRLLLALLLQQIYTL